MCKAMVLLSGGLDSTTALAWAIEKFKKENVHALGIRYGQKHSKEMKCARAVAEYYGVPYHHIELPPTIWAGSDCTLLEGRGKIEESTYSEQINSAQQKDKPAIDTSVPFRNGVFLAIAAAQAMSRGCSAIVIGVHQDDSGAAYPDCDPVFIGDMRSAIYRGTGKSVWIEAPLVSATKENIVQWGLAHKVPYELTWSCYNGGEKACGKCATCLDRLKAFQLNNTVDPIEYMEGIKK